VPVPAEAQRIDRWLWHARLVRTRSAAVALASSGYVRVNGQRVRAASRVVHAGDVVTVAFAHTVRVLKVRGFIERRGPPIAGAALYEELGFRAVRPSAPLNLRTNKACDRSNGPKNRV
jgi:ribosome-associated heat shock protein Hsp15